MDIRKIELIAGGDKGLLVLYLKQEEKKGRTFTNEVKEKRKYPIHNDLDQLFKDLRYYLLHITGVIRDDMDDTHRQFIESDANVTAVKIEGTVFSIIGTKRCDWGTQFKIETPKIDQHDEYPHYEKIWEIIKGLKEETRLYMNGTKSISAEEAIVRQIQAGRRKEISMDNYNDLSPDQQKELLTTLLTKDFGSTVTHIEDTIPVDDDEPTHETQVINLDEAI